MRAPRGASQKPNISKRKIPHTSHHGVAERRRRGSSRIFLLRAPCAAVPPVDFGISVAGFEARLGKSIEVLHPASSETFSERDRTLTYRGMRPYSMLLALLRQLASHVGRAATANHPGEPVANAP